jgi:hypothetical protein
MVNQLFRAITGVPKTYPITSESEAVSLRALILEYPRAKNISFATLSPGAPGSTVSRFPPGTVFLNLMIWERGKTSRYVPKPYVLGTLPPLGPVLSGFRCHPWNVFLNLMI